MPTIDIDKVNVCDSCFKTKRVNDKKNDIIKIEFESSRKTVYLCEECVKDLLEGLKQILEVQ